MVQKRKITEQEANNIYNLVYSKIYAKGLNVKILAKMIAEKYPNASSNYSNLSKKINEGRIKYIEMVELADVAGYEIAWIDKEKI